MAPSIPCETEEPAAEDEEEDGPLEDWTGKELAEECKTLGLSDQGVKAVLVARLKEARAAAVEAAPAEEAVVEEPAAEGPITEEPASEEATAEEPVAS